MMASEYGWNVERILSLTSRQISSFIKEIGSRQNQKFEMEAKFHGFEIKGGRKTNIEIDKKSKEAILKAAKERINGRKI